LGTIQPVGQRGSLKWTQRLVNGNPGLIDPALRRAVGGSGQVDWLSPLAADDFREYRDQGMLDLLDVSLPVESLADFWPGRGPQWDALARIGDKVVLVEAKAHVGELLSGACRASSPRSRHMIEKALDRTTLAYRARPGLDWMQRFYQYANRLAHLYLLREVNGIDAHLVFLYFVNDREMKGPGNEGEWRIAIQVLHEAMGLRGRVPRGVHDLFVDVSELEGVTV